MTSSVIRSCMCEVEGGKGWTNQIDHPGPSKKLVYDDTTRLRWMLQGAADPAPPAHWSPDPLTPRPLAASHWTLPAAARHLAAAAFSRWLLPLEQALSSESAPQ